jgi:RNA polymerase sigma-70 factor (ECF subfamily)
MDRHEADTTTIGLLLDRFRGGDASARDELLGLACERLGRLARRMIRDYPGVARWEQADDVLQNAAIRLCRALEDVPPESPRSFFNLAAVAMRRELIDLARRHFGPLGMGTHHESVGGRGGSSPGLDAEAAEADDPSRLADWTDFHEQVDALPPDQREVVALVWYQGLTQAEAGLVLGVTERVVRWRWRAARLALHRTLVERPGV